MATKSDTASANTPPAAADISSELNTTLAAADTTAAQRVQQLQWVHQARVSQLSRTAADLKAQQGAKSVAVKNAEAAVAAAQATAGRVAIAHQALTTLEPQVAANGWALHGRAFDAQLQPVSGFTVFLVDDKKTYQETYGFSYTDDTGYFLLNYAGPDAAAAKPAPPADAATTAPQLFLEITDTNANPVYLSTTAFAPVLGTATYQNITLAAGKQTIGQPTAAIRKVAVPPKPKKAT
jgi:hypothetical protein